MWEMEQRVHDPRHGAVSAGDEDAASRWQPPHHAFWRSRANIHHLIHSSLDSNFYGSFKYLCMKIRIFLKVLSGKEICNQAHTLSPYCTVLFIYL